MRILISGACGFVGNEIIRGLFQAVEGLEIFGIDNLSRSGSELNREPLKKLGVKLIHGDLRNFSDLEGIPKVDWVIDAAANPSVLAGIDGQSSSRQLIDHNLNSTVNTLEFCRLRQSGFILLSTSRVYSTKNLSKIELEVVNQAYRPRHDRPLIPGLSGKGLSENFSTQAPISLYGATKLASEILALEYLEAFQVPVWLNRCGVLAGAGQFGRADQGIFSFWIHSYSHNKPLKYIGFGGNGFQVRDCLHPLDLLPLLLAQMNHQTSAAERIHNLGGGIENSCSLAQLNRWCQERFGPRQIAQDKNHRTYDVPWIVMDSSRAGRNFNWKPQRNLHMVFEEIAQHALKNPHWLDLAST
jgi:CDP-paratose 2-epimerase